MKEMFDNEVSFDVEITEENKKLFEELCSPWDRFQNGTETINDIMNNCPRYGFEIETDSGNKEMLKLVEEKYFERLIRTTKKMAETIAEGRKITAEEENKKRIARALDLDENYFEEESEVAKIVVKKEASEIRNTKETKVDVEDVSNIIEVSKELGAIRFKLIQMVEKTREEVKRYNIEDQTFLHRLEFLDSLTDEEAIDMLLKEKQSREHRRRNKNRLILIQELLNSIYIKNPNAFIVRAINSKGDILKTIEALKEDDSLYVGGKNVSN